MEYKFGIDKEERKALVKAISEITGQKAVYQGAPSFAFSVGAYTIDRDGTLLCGDADGDAPDGLLSELAARGFVFESDINEITPVVPEQAQSEPNDPAECLADAEIGNARHTVQPVATKMYEELSPSGTDIFAYYLLHNPDEPGAAAVLSHETLALIKDKADKYIICADVCYLSEDELAQWNIAFRKFPRDWNLLPDAVQEQIRALESEPMRRQREAMIAALTYTGCDHDGSDTGESDPGGGDGGKPADGEDPYEGSATRRSGKLSINMPLTGFTASSLDNLNKLVAAKAWIIRKMAKTEDLSIERGEKYLHFAWFKPDASAAEMDAYSRLIARLCETAKAKRRVNAEERPLQPDDNEKFKARCFLLSLGFIGDEFTQARKILLAPMSGNGSHKSGNGKKAAPESMRTADSGDESDTGPGVDEPGDSVEV